MTQENPGAPPGHLSKPKQLPPGRKEDRKSPRRRVLKEGKVVFGQTQAVIDCTIDNQSEGGAHIRHQQILVVPLLPTPFPIVRNSLAST